MKFKTIFVVLIKISLKHTDFVGGDWFVDVP